MKIILARTVSAIFIVLLLACSEVSEQEKVASVRQQFEQAKYSEAALKAKAILEQNPSAGEARYLLGASLLALGDLAASEIELKKSLELEYSSDQVIPVLAKVMLARRSLKQLTEAYGDTELESPEASNSLKTTLALAFAQLGNTDRANSLLSLVLSKIPDHVPATLVKARLLAGGSNFRRALQLLDNLLTKEPNNADVLLLKADITLISDDNPLLAAELYKKVLQIKRKDVDAHFALAAIFLNQQDLIAAQRQIADLSLIAPSSPQTKFFEAQLAYLQRDYAKAKSAIQEILRISPNNTKALQFAGATEMQMGALQLAESYFAKALYLEPTLVSVRRLLAQASLRLGQPDKALVTLRPILEQANPESDTIALAGEAYLQQGDQNKAKEYYQWAAKLKPSNAKLMTSLALIEILQGGVERGLQGLENIAAGDQGINADMALITSRMQRGQWELALKDIEKLDKKIPGKPTAPNLRGRAQMSLQKLGEARKSFEAALSRDKMYYPAIAALTQLDFQDERPDLALTRLNELLKKNPTHPKALLAVAELKSRTGASKDEVTALLREAVKSNPIDPSTRVALISNFKRRNDFKGAVDAAQEAVLALPNSTEMLDHLGLAQMASGEASSALATFKKLATRRANDPLPYMRMADVFISAKDPENAKSSLKRALEIKPGYLDAQFGLISLAVRGGRHNEAVQVAKTVQHGKPEDAIGFLLEGDIYLIQKKHQEAILAFSGGLKKRDSGRLAVKLHNTFIDAKRVNDAAKFASDWQLTHPADSGFLAYLGGLSLADGSYAAAEKYYAAALGIEPRNFVFINNIAWLRSKQNKAGAAALAASAVALSPKNSVLLDTYALTLAGEGQFDKAVEAAKAALAFAPGVPLFQLNLAKLYMQIGQPALAKIELEKLSALGGRYDNQVEISKLLKTLSP